MELNDESYKVATIIYADVAIFGYINFEFVNSWIINYL